MLRNLLGAMVLCAVLPLAAGAAEVDEAAACLGTDTFHQPEAAVTACDVALKAPGVADRQRSKLLFQRGDAMHWAGRPGDAVSNFTEALALDPQNSAARTQRGWAWTRIGDYGKAYR